MKNEHLTRLADGGRVCERSGALGLSPELVAFRRLVARIIFAFCALTNGLATVLITAGVWVVPDLVTIANAAVMVVASVLLVIVTKRPDLTYATGWVLLLATVAQTSVTSYVATEDVMRFTWFFPIIGAAILLGGGLRAAVIVGLSFCAVIVIALHGGMLPVQSLTTLCATLFVASAALYMLNRSFVIVVAKLELSRRDLERQANTDPLTGLANRLAFTRTLGELDPRGASYTIAVCDLDHFKAINDRYGHAAGDRVLKDVAQCLAASAGEDAIAVRLGGEEFCVLFPDAVPQIAIDRTEAMRGLLEKRTVLFERQPISVTASFGLAHASGGRVRGTRALKAADAALYDAKRKGRNRMQIAA